MDIEQLKLILETLKGATGEAKDLIIFWVLADAIPSLLKFGIGFGVLAFIAKRGIAAVSASDCDTRAIAEIRDYLVPGQTGTHLVETERRLVRAFISNAIRAKKEGKF